MGIKRTSKSGLFLLELVLGILFFSLASAVCVSLFVNARLTSARSRDLTEAMLQAQTVAESYRSVDGDMERLAQLLDAQQQEDVLCLFYDKDWNPASDSNYARYTLWIRSEDHGRLDSAEILVTKGESDLFSLSVKQYQSINRKETT